MKSTRIAGSLFVTVCFAVLATAQVIQDRIQVTTPTAPWTLVFEGEKISLRDAKIKASEASGYFLMIDDRNQVNFSLYIEPVENCKTADSCRDYILAAGNPAWGKYQDLAKGSVGNFSYFEFYRPEVQGQPVKMLDMYAQFVEKGYWIDLHISKVLYKKEDHALFENLIKGIKFVPKDAKEAAVPADDEKIAAAATGWLKLWDSQKCKETYDGLTSLSKDSISGPQWIPYCQDVHQKLGKLQSRKLIANSTIKSLPPKPEFSGATHGYRSVFQNATVVEIVTLTREKDGRWTVSNYLPR